MLLEHRNWSVVVNAPPNSELLAKLRDATPDVLLIDLENANSRSQDAVAGILSECAMPILINDQTGILRSHAAGYENAAIVQQLADVLGKPLETERNSQAVTATSGSEASAANEPLREIDEEIPDESYARIQSRQRVNVSGIWVLSASLGGPQALSAFLSEIPSDLDIAFLVVQRLADSCMPLLASHLLRNTQLEVVLARDRLALQPNVVVLLSGDQCIDIEDGGVLRVNAAQSSYGFSATDHTMETVARIYKERAGAVIFSGMGNDGVQGSRAILEAGGTVWTQSAESCVVSTMPEYVRNHCNISYSDRPSQLAKQLCERVAGRFGDFAPANGAGR